MTHPTPTTVALLLIGDELLTGKIEDANGPLVVRTLRERGAELRELRTVPDDIHVIARAMRELSEEHDVLVTSGGVGPTHDDVTLEAAALAFGDTLDERPELVALIDAAFGHAPASHKVWMRMACVPTRSVLVHHPGTRWPAQRIENMWILPGVPQIFERQFLEISSAWACAPVAQVTLYLRSGEGAIADALRAAVERFSSVRFGSYPVLDGEGFRTRVTVESRAAEVLDEAVQWLRDALGADQIVRETRGTQLDARS